MRLFTAWRSRKGAEASDIPHAVDIAGLPLVGMEYDRRAPHEWQALLDAHHIPGQARLVVAWEHGDVWQPIDRWIIWQMQPFFRGDLAQVDATVRSELTGPSPRKGAELRYVMATINGKNELRPRMFGGPCQLIDRRTWALHREWYANTGERVFPRRLWVCQGAAGGHPFHITTEEQSLRALQGVSADVPSAGDLPYAPMDARVIGALERYDLWKWANNVGAHGDIQTQTVRNHVARLRDTEREANKLRWQQWQDFSGEIAGGMAHAARKDGLHLHRLTPVGHTPRPVDYERLKDRYLDDTNLEAVL